MSEVNLDTGGQHGATGHLTSGGNRAVLASQFPQWVRALCFPLATAHSPAEIDNKLLIFLQTRPVYSVRPYSAMKLQ